MAEPVRIGLLDPSIGTRNAGDLIIREAIGKVLHRLEIEPDAITQLPTQKPLNAEERRAAGRCTKFLVGGTNLLSSNMPWYMQWKLRPADITLFRKNVMLLGVGWWQYQRPPNRFSAMLLQRALSPAGHSVRDSLTKEHLSSIGVAATNTTCPTLWDLPEYPEFNQSMSESVVVALTDYNRDPHLDKLLLQQLRRNYKNLVVWPQGAKDARYLSQLAPDIRLLTSGVFAFEQVLKQGYDYVGTRLHAGVRALQLGARSTVIEIDNRATEIAKDTRLPTVPRDLSGESITKLFDERIVRLDLPHEQITGWLLNASRWLRVP